MTSTEFSDQVSALAARMRDTLRSGPRTAWDLRLELKAPLSRIYMAAGELLARGQAQAVPSGQTYELRLKTADEARDPLAPGVGASAGRPGLPVSALTPAREENPAGAEARSGSSTPV